MRHTEQGKYWCYGCMAYNHDNENDYYCPKCQKRGQVLEQQPATNQPPADIREEFIAAAVIRTLRRVSWELGYEYDSTYVNRIVQAATPSNSRYLNNNDRIVGEAQKLGLLTREVDDFAAMTPDQKIDALFRRIVALEQQAGKIK